MTDLFAVLGLTRSAWLDAAEIKQQHHDLMATGHPDKSSAAPASATLLNEARRKAWVDFCQSILMSNEFLYLD